MTKIAVLDDWQHVAPGSADWAPLKARAEIVFFDKAFAGEDDVATKLADFDIVMAMRERTAFPASLIRRLPKLRMLGMTGARNASLDTPACTARASEPRRARNSSRASLLNRHSSAPAASASLITRSE